MKKINSIILVSFVFTILVSNSNAANFVTLKSSFKNKYVCAENAGTDSLLANRERAYIWETFEMINNDDGTISFKSHMNNRYVCAEDGGNGLLIANRDAIGPWEKFSLTTVSFTKRSVLKSMANGKYVSVRDGGQLVASATTVGIREYFIISANLVTLKSIYNGLYVSADNYGYNPLVARPQNAYQWETYEMICHSDYTVSFKSQVNNLYVCAGNTTKDYLIANAITTTDCTKFNVITNFTSICAYQSVVNQKYVSVADDGQLIANASTIDIREQFEVFKLIDDKLTWRNWVTLKSFNNSMYVSAENSGNDPLAADRSEASVWETFDLIFNTDGTVSLLSASNAKYVCAEYYAEGYLITNRVANLEWEKFYLITDLSTNRSAFQSIVNWKYVTVVSDGKLIANASTFGIQESFKISTLSSQSSPPIKETKVIMTSYFANSLYVSAANAGKDPLIANRQKAGQWEAFNLIVNSDSTISFLSYANSKYVSAENAAQGYLVASGNEIGPWEKFNVYNYNKLYTIQSIVNGRFVTIANNSQLIANVETPRTSELFHLYQLYKV